MGQADEALLKLFLNKMVIKFDMLGPLMKNRILCDINGCKLLLAKLAGWLAGSE